MQQPSATKRIWGWFFFDFASQPYNTLLLTFIFGPYIIELVGEGSRGQAVWGYGVGAAGVVMAILAPILGAIADKSGGRLPFIWVFSAMYVVGAWMLWYAAPGDFNLTVTLFWFAVGLIGMEFATIFTNAMLPDLGPEEEIGRLSGSGWAFGYVGGLLALVIMLAVFQTSPETGKTMVGLPAMFGLDPAAQEGTRIVGPLSAVWYAVFMIPFFLWVRDVRRPGTVSIGAAARGALPELMSTLKHLPEHKSLTAFLFASMFYRDALNGIYVFGGIYAKGVLGWTAINIGIFGILAIITGAIFAWIGGRADKRFGPKPVILLNVVILSLCVLAIVFVGRDSVFGIAVGSDSSLPDIAFYAIGAVIGACGGALQSSSRSMLVRQAEGDKMTESFGLYALTGKATSFLAPLSIGVVTDVTDSQQLGIVPLIVLFLLGLFLLRWVKGTPGKP